MIPENLKSSKCYFQNCYRMWILILLRLLKGMSQFKVLGPALLELTIRGMGPDIQGTLWQLYLRTSFYMFTFTLFRDLLKVQLNSRFTYLHTDKRLACLNIPTAILDAYGTLAGPRLTLQKNVGLLHIQYHLPALHKYFRSTSVSEMVIHI